MSIIITVGNKTSVLVANFFGPKLFKNGPLSGPFVRWESLKLIKPAMALNSERA